MNPASEPSCAICNSPAEAQCPCEADRLELAVRQAEGRALDSLLSEARGWVMEHARAHILQSFSALRSYRLAQHQAYVHSLRQATYFQPHPIELQNANLELKRGIDEDWRQSVQRYPEVLDYFYSLVDISMPSDTSPEVIHPAIGGYGRGKRRRRGGGLGLDPALLERPRSRMFRDGGLGRAPMPIPIPPLVPPAGPWPQMPGGVYAPGLGGYRQHGGW